MNFERQKLGLTHDQHLESSNSIIQELLSHSLFPTFLLNYVPLSHWSKSLKSTKHAFQGKNENPFQPWLEIRYPTNC